MNKIIKELNSFAAAFRGIFFVIKSESHFRFHLFAATLVTISGLYFHITKTEWCILLLCFAAVMASEIINSSIEKLTDLVSPDYNEQAGKIKDMAAGAVLVCAIISVVVGVIIFFPYIN